LSVHTVVASVPSINTISHNYSLKHSTVSFCLFILWLFLFLL
jgi:hypothetical protein